MKKLLIYFLKIRRELLVLLVLAVFSYFLIEIVLNQYVEIFTGAHVISQFVSKLCIAYITSFIFYFVVVHIKSEKDKENVNEFIGHKVYSIIISAHLMIQPLQQKIDKKASFRYLTRGELGGLLRSVNRFDKEAPYSINDESANWIEWLEHLKETTEDSLSEIFLRYQHVDTKLIKILTRVEHSMLFKQFSLLYAIRSDDTFSPFLIQFHTYLTIIKALEEYADENLKEYKSLTGEFLGYNPNDWLKPY